MTLYFPVKSIPTSDDDIDRGIQPISLEIHSEKKDIPALSIELYLFMFLFILKNETKVYIIQNIKNLYHFIPLFFIS